MSIPELCLEQLSTGRIEAAQILNDSRVVAAQLRVRARLEGVHSALGEHHLRATEGKLSFGMSLMTRSSMRFNRLSSMAM